MKPRKFPSDLAQLIQIRFYRPRAYLFLINRMNSYVPPADTTSRPTAAAVGVVPPPRENRLKRHASRCQADGGDIPPPYSFQTKELGAEPIMVQGFEGWAPKGFDSRPRATESGTTTGEPIRGRGPSK